MSHLLVNIIFTLFMLSIATTNYPGGAAISRLHRLAKNETNVHVHIDNLAAQTGVSRFTQINDNWKYNKEEKLEPGTEKMFQFTHMLTEARSKYSPNLKPYAKTHEVVDIIEAFSGITFNYNSIPPIKIKTKPSIYILKIKPLNADWEELKREALKKALEDSIENVSNGGGIHVQAIENKRKIDLKTILNDINSGKFVSDSREKVSYEEFYINSDPEVRKLIEELRNLKDESTEINFDEDTNDIFAQSKMDNKELDLNDLKNNVDVLETEIKNGQKEPVTKKAIKNIAESKKIKIDINRIKSTEDDTVSEQIPIDENLSVQEEDDYLQRIRNIEEQLRQELIQEAENKALEEKKKMEKLQQERERKEIEAKLKETQRIQEEQKKREAERIKELLRKQEEEKIREELRKKEEERKQEELRIEEEKRLKAEQKRQEELRLREEKRKQEELRRQEELRLREEMRLLEEANAKRIREEQLKAQKLEEERIKAAKLKADIERKAEKLKKDLFRAEKLKQELDLRAEELKQDLLRVEKLKEQAENIDIMTDEFIPTKKQNRKQMIESKIRVRLAEKESMRNDRKNSVRSQIKDEIQKVKKATDTTQNISKLSKNSDNEKILTEKDNIDTKDINNKNNQLIYEFFDEESVPILENIDDYLFNNTEET